MNLDVFWLFVDLFC